MSGHSHWANIKGKKTTNDQQRSKVFSKVTREIILAINQSGGVVDPDINIQLRSAMEKAKEVSMPKENITRLIERIKERAEVVTEVVYEAMLHNGVSLIIKTLTDNPNRTHSELNMLLVKNGAKLVAKGSASYMFEYCGLMEIDNKTEEEILKLAETINAIDLENEEGKYYLYVPYDNLSRASKEAETIGITKAPELIYKPKTIVNLSSVEAQKTISIIERIDDHDDVQAVFSNFGFGA